MGIEAVLWVRSNVKISDQQGLGVLKELAIREVNGICEATLTSIAEACGKARSTTYQHIELLAQQGHIRVFERKNARGAKLPEDKEQRRDFIIFASGCGPVDAASQISYDCAQRVIERIESEGMDNLLAAWEAERAMEQQEAEQSASAPTISTEEVAKLLVDLTEILPEGSAADFVGEWRAANCAEDVDIYGLSHAQAMSLLQAAREYSALEGAKAA